MSARVAPAPLPLEHLADPTGVAWLRRSEGYVGRGRMLSFDPGTGPGRFERAEAAVIDALGRLAGRGHGRPVAFGSFTFDPDEAGSVVVVPALLEVVRAGTVTRLELGEAGPPPPFPEQDVDRVRYWGPSVSELSWLEAVAQAEAEVRSGVLEKVVLARDLRVWARRPLPVGRIVARLAARFPDCYTFALEGLVGSSPELLVSRRGEEVASLVLAGSVGRGPDAAADDALAAWLAASPKDAVEHEIAVRSVVEVLEDLCDELEVGEPRVLRLANVQHLATEVRGRGVRLGALALAGALHPTAAVCGLPRDAALDRIRALEGMRRGRYAGPVGWVDAGGDGEWAIALRCAEIEGATARLFAGAGIVAGSTPEGELEETRLKLRAMQGALAPPA